MPSRWTSTRCATLGRGAGRGCEEHIEEAGIHSGDSACALPPQTLSREVVATLEEPTRAIAESLGVIGLLNVQLAVKDGVAYVIEANPAEPDGSVRGQGDGYPSCQSGRSSDAGGDIGPAA